jgi:P4 family phage/plasmid primase-like protien
LEETKCEESSERSAPPIEAAKALLEIIDDQYFHDRDSWLKIGTALRKEYGDLDAFPLFDKHSQRSDKYPGLRECKAEFEGMNVKSGVGFGTIIHYAKKSNETKTQQWFNTYINKQPEPQTNSTQILDPAINRAIQLASNNRYELLTQDDYGLAQIFLSEYRDDIRMVGEKGDGEAYVWDENKLLWHRWKPEFVKIYIQGKLRPIVQSIYKREKDELNSMKGEIKRKGLNSKYKEKLGNRIDSKQKLVTILSKAVQYVTATRHAKGIMTQCIHECLDKEFEDLVNKSENELPMKGGMLINLKTGEVRKRTREDYWSFELDVSIADEVNQEFRDIGMKWLESICLELDSETKEMTNYLTELIGYSMTGRTTERSLFVLWGHGRNGKTTLMEVISKIMGGFYTQLHDNVMMERNTSGSATPELMALLTARIGVLSETKKGANLDPKRVKELTGNDQISARALYSDMRTFKPIAKYFLLTNHLPKFDARDQAMIDRVVLFPFQARFEKTKENQSFADKFKNINLLNEIFRLFVEGAMRYYERGSLPETPERAKVAMDSYKSDLDVLGKWISTCATGSDADGKPLRWNRSECYESFRTYANGEGMETTRDCPMLNRGSFYKALEKSGYKNKKIMGTRYIMNIAEAPPQPESE